MVGLLVFSIWAGVALAGWLVPPFFPRFYDWLRVEVENDARYFALVMWPFALPVALFIGTITLVVDGLKGLEKHISIWSRKHMAAKEKAAQEKALRIRVAQEQKETAIPVAVPNEQCDYRHSDCHTCGKPLV